MTPHPSPAHEAVDCEKLLVHNWRVARLRRRAAARAVQPAGAPRAGATTP